MCSLIWKDIVEYFHIYARKGAIIGIAVGVLVALAGWYARRRTGKVFLDASRKADQLDGSARLLGQVAWKSLLAALLAMYIYFVMQITLLSRGEKPGPIVNLRLFGTFYGSMDAWRMIWENLILFIPYGMLLYMLHPFFRYVLASLLTGALSSLMIEITQRVTLRGRFEVDDIMLNTLGMLIGFTVACVGHAAWSWLRGRLHFTGRDVE